MINELIKKIFDTSDSDRSLQRDIGPSEIGGLQASSVASFTK